MRDLGIAGFRTCVAVASIRRSAAANGARLVLPYGCFTRRPLLLQTDPYSSFTRALGRSQRRSLATSGQYIDAGWVAEPCFFSATNSLPIGETPLHR